MKTIATIVILTAAVLFAGPVSDKCRQDIWVTDGTVLFSGIL